ncbi:dcp2-domain-containing protein [Lichtheimia corymbifera JMRC:FSU:9682]|uniref:Dcp2-domain-containing protein n=1 Tax=Lichtheimia corymbifera JMRC:FSU:9682 TaxID=1263082 RepID=A0A068SF96_9FUNG|nr:dcp2-domain-containing protein [Lichtheimia corymbifera JMRC:FSU:9682]
MLMQTNALATASFEEILDDLSTRFIINVPEAELKSPHRICFQVEQAHWFYEDFVRLLQPNLQSFQLKTFSEKIFKHCPLLKQWAHQHERAYADFMQYRFRIPVCGAILLNENLDKCVLVKGWSSKSGWSFPRGKINQDEEYDHCAIREVMEETGYDISPLIRDTYLQCTIREQSIRLYIVCGVPEDTKFMPQTRKEISQVEWFKLDDLPGLKPGSRGRFYMVVPFVSKLKLALPILRREQQKAKGGKPTKNKANGHRKKNKNNNNVTQSDKSSASPPSPPNDNNSAAEPSAALKSLLGISASTTTAPATPTTAATTPPNETPEPSSALKSLLGISPQQANASESTTVNGTARQSDHVIEQQQQPAAPAPPAPESHPLLALLRQADSRYSDSSSTTNAPTTPPLLAMLQRADPNNASSSAAPPPPPQPPQQPVASNSAENGSNGTHPLIALLQSAQQQQQS